MTQIIAPNNYRKTVAATMLVGDLTLTVSDASPLGTVTSPDYMLLTLAKVVAGVETQWEIMKVQRPAGGNVLTIPAGGRAQESTTALQWEIGDRVSGRLTTGTVQPMVGISVFTKEYNSSVTPGVSAITPAGLLTLPHGLGVVPKLVQSYLQCITAEAGYVIDDVLIPNPHQNSFYTSPGAPFSRSGTSITIDGRNISVRYAVQTETFYIIDKTTGGIAALTNANWRFFVRAFA